MKRLSRRMGSVALVGLLALGLSGAVLIAQEQKQDEDRATEQGEGEGKVIQILPEGAERALERAQRLLTLPGHPEDRARQRLATPFYIGLAATPVSDALRAHVELPEGVGLMVEHVFEGSPAEEAGVQQYDILLKADGAELTNLQELVAVVEQHGGDEATSFPLEVIRRGERSQLEITPAKRPEINEEDQPDSRHGANRNRQGQPQRAGQLGLFGGLMADPFSANQVPGGVSVSITRQNDGPAHITVKRGEETWEVVGDDPESLKQLPEDLRPMVERMLAAPQGGAQFDPDFPGEGMFQHLPPEIEQRFRQMEEQMRQMQRELLDNRNAEEAQE